MKMQPIRAALISAVAAAALFIAGCGSETDAREIQPNHAPNYSLINDATGEGQVGHFATSPEDLIKTREPKVIVVGSVAGVERGRNIYLAQDATVPLPFIVLRIRVSNTLRSGSRGDIVDGRVYVEMYQGAIGADGKPAYPISEWRDAIPVGTRTMLFLDDNYRAKMRAENEGRGHPGGTHVMSAIPQGMLFEYDGKLVGADEYVHEGPHPLGMDSTEETVAHVKDYLDSHG